jgi:hypothetical protein
VRSNQQQPADPSIESTEPPAPTHRRRRFIGWIVLAAYSLLLLCRAFLHSRAGDAPYVPVWELQDSDRFVAWIGGFVLTGVYEFAFFIPLGFLAALAVPYGSRALRRLPINIAALAIAGAVAVLATAVETWPSWHLGTVASLVLPLLGCLFGAWIGTTWRRGRRARLWLLPKIALLVLIAVLGAGFLVWLSVEEEPLPFEAAAVASAEKREIVRLIRSKSPRSLEEGQTHTLRLTEHDVNVLLAWGLSLGSAERKAQVNLATEAASFAVSLGLTPGDGKPRYLNVQLAGNLQVDQGTLRLKVNRCRLGHVRVPSWLINPWCPVVASLLAHDRRSKPFLDAIEAAAIGTDWIEATYTRVNLPPGFREDLFGPTTAGEKLLAATRAQVIHLLSAVQQLPRGERPQFDMCFQTVFALARVRSVEGDPVAENRAAIFALGLLLGHPRLEHFLGHVLPSRGYDVAQRVLGRVRLRKRTDWTKHFCVSAALTLLSDTLVSDAAGLFKEELDSDTGGSGFSFADLLADRAGTTFAARATRGEAAARVMQDRLARGFEIDDVFPHAADLPEGIPDAELQSRYGGVGGEAYLHLTAEIERRIAACAAYQ